MKRSLVLVLFLALTFGTASSFAAPCGPPNPMSTLLWLEEENAPIATPAVDLFPPTAAPRAGGACTADDRAACRQDCCTEGGCEGFQVLWSYYFGYCMCNCLGYCSG